MCDSVFYRAGGGVDIKELEGCPIDYRPVTFQYLSDEFDIYGDVDTPADDALHGSNRVFTMERLRRGAGKARSLSIQRISFGARPGTFNPTELIFMVNGANKVTIDINGAGGSISETVTYKSLSHCFASPIVSSVFWHVDETDLLTYHSLYAG